MSKNQFPNAEIRRSRSKTNPFKVAIIAGNGEMLLSSELLSTRANCLKNIRATMKVFRGSSVFVRDSSGKVEKQFTLYASPKLNIN